MVQAASKSTFISEQLLYTPVTPLVISRNDKNKQLTLLSQFKLAFQQEINFLHYKIIGAPENFLNQPTWGSLAQFCTFLPKFLKSTS
jgi:hypothetical protein